MKIEVTKIEFGVLRAALQSLSNYQQRRAVDAAKFDDKNLASAVINDAFGRRHAAERLLKKLNAQEAL